MAKKATHKKASKKAAVKGGKKRARRAVTAGGPSEALGGADDDAGDLGADNGGTDLADWKAGQEQEAPAGRTFTTPPPAGVVDLVQISSVKVLKGSNHRTAQDIEGLASSMASQGQQQPIGVMRTGGKANDLVLLWGERRLAAARSLGWETIEAKVYPDGLSPSEIEALRATENIARAEPTAAEKAVAVVRFMDRFYPELTGVKNAKLDWALTPEHLRRQLVDAAVARFGVSEKWARGCVYLLRLPEGIQAAVGAGHVPMSWAAELAKVRDEYTLEGWQEDHLSWFKGAANPEYVAANPDDFSDEPPVTFKAMTIERVRQFVEGSLRDLSRVPWKLDLRMADTDGKVLPACIGCPDRSAEDIFLFPGQEEGAAGTCRNQTCFQVKEILVQLTIQNAVRAAGKKAAVKKRGDYKPAVLSRELLGQEVVEGQEPTPADAPGLAIKPEVLARKLTKEYPTSAQRAKAEESGEPVASGKASGKKIPEEEPTWKRRDRHGEALAAWSAELLPRIGVEIQAYPDVCAVMWHISQRDPFDDRRTWLYQENTEGAPPPSFQGEHDREAAAILNRLASPGLTLDEPAGLPPVFAPAAVQALQEVKAWLGELEGSKRKKKPGDARALRPPVFLVDLEPLAVLEICRLLGIEHPPIPQPEAFGLPAWKGMP